MYYNRGDDLIIVYYLKYTHIHKNYLGESTLTRNYNNSDHVYTVIQHPLDSVDYYKSTLILGGGGHTPGRVYTNNILLLDYTNMGEEQRCTIIWEPI